MQFNLGGFTLNKENISEKQGICLVIMFILGSSLLIGSGGGVAEKDGWLGVICGIIFSAPAIYIYARLLSKFPGHDLFYILEFAFGKILGKLISLTYIWFAFHLGALVFRNYSDFTNTVVYPDTPIILPLSFLLVTCVLGVKLGIEVLGRWCEFFIIAVIMLIILTTSLALHEMHIKYILPIFYNGITPILHAGFLSFSFPFCETVIFMMFFSSLNSSASPYKIYFWGLLIGGFILFIITARNILLIRAIGINRNYFPSYVAVNVIQIGEFIQRLELAVSTAFILNIFTKINMCLLATCVGLEKVFNLSNYRIIVLPVALLMATLSIIVYSSAFESLSWANNIWPYYAFIFQAIFPLLTFIIVEIKQKSTV